MSRLSELAVKVYGQHWIVGMGRHLDIGRATLYRWDSDEDLVPRMALRLLEAYIALGWTHDCDTNAVG